MPLRNTNRGIGLALASALAGLAGCGEPTPAEPAHGEAAVSGEYERGPHRGRMLRDGDLAIEMTISIRVNAEENFVFIAKRILFWGDTEQGR